MANSEEQGKNRWQLPVICGTLLLITLAVYWPVLGNDFVNYDDPDYVESNAHVQAGLTWNTVVWAFTTGHASNWHPLTWLSHALDCQWYGLKPRGHHLTNLLFHCANGLLLFWVWWRMTGAKWPSAFVAALFAWHPAHVESVAWISERKDVLSTFFWLLTMLAYAAYARESRVRGPKARVYYAITLVFFALGLLSKPMLVTLPFVLLLLDYWPLDRDTEAGAPGGLSRLKIWRRLVWEKIPFLLLAAISSVVTFLVQQKGGAVASLGAISRGARAANAVVSYLRYVGKLVWPENLSVLYPHPGFWPVWRVAVAGLLLIAVSAGGFIFGRRRKYLLVGWLWFLGTLVPVIGLVQVGVQSMADRYLYIPAVGLFVMLAWGGAEFSASRVRREWTLGVAGGLVLAGCLWLTAVQVRYWKNGETLFRHVVQATQNNYLAYNNLGFFLYNHGKSDEAMEDYRKSVEINPNYEDAQNNLGHALAGKGRNAEAITHFEIALRIKPGLVEARNNLGNALSALGHLDGAIEQYLLALKYKPDDEDAHNNLGIARAMQGRLDEAVELLTEAVSLKPTDAGAQGNLGNALAAQHKLAEAAKHFQIALRLNPRDAQARNNLGNVLTEQGKLDEARENYARAIELNPQNPEANYNLGLVLLRQGKRGEAQAHFQAAVQLRPDYPEAQRQLEALKRAP